MLIWAEDFILPMTICLAGRDQIKVGPKSSWAEVGPGFRIYYFQKPKIVSKPAIILGLQDSCKCCGFEIRANALGLFDFKELGSGENLRFGF